jgi:HEAT repeat protein
MSVTPESVQALLASQDFGDRLSAINQLRQLDPAVAFDLIQPAIFDSNVRVRYAAVSQMASLGQQNLTLALDVLRRCLLEDPEADVQAAAADSLSALKLTEAYDDLEAVYERSSEWLVQFSIIAALGELGDPRAFNLLQKALRSDNELVKTAAVGALGELGDERAVELLIPYATDPDWQIRHRVVQALSRFTQPEAQSIIQQLSQDDCNLVAQEAASYLNS